MKQRSIKGTKKGRLAQQAIADKRDKKMFRRFEASRKSERPIIRQGRALNVDGDDDRAWLRDL
jgi:hypothetical protein